MSHLAELRAALDLRRLRRHPRGAMFAGRWTLDDLGAVGEVRLTGVTLGPSACDPPGTWRASRCELLRLYVTDDTHAEALSWSLRVPVTAGLPTSSEEGGPAS